ncbi:MAG: hypothetical protein JO117_06550 [Verrucomicrobia bacterium]|nr:hypothetical protein [Verrucomicrobiota bacterium]MBV9659106.1 hypothetical protein [Verrucomicrobiota bacterium]
MPRPPTNDYHDLGGGLYEWSAYDRASRVDLYTHALRAGDRLVLFDPIPLRKERFDEILAAVGNLPAGPILLTNGNHARKAAQFRKFLKNTTVVLAAAEARAALREDDLEIDGELVGNGGNAPPLPDGLQPVPLPGFAPGETAFFHPENGGTFIVGDALINLPPYDFAPLPEKYCADPKTARRSLRCLLDFSFARLVFAHGDPLLENARGRLEALLSALQP